MKNYVYSGRTMTVAAPYDVASGGLVVVGGLFGVAAHAALTGQDVEIQIGGVYTDIPKTSAQAWTLGAKVYWDAANKLATTTAAGNTPIGIAAAGAGNPSGFGSVRLNSSF